MKESGIANNELPSCGDGFAVGFGRATHFRVSSQEKITSPKFDLYNISSRNYTFTRTSVIYLCVSGERTKRS